MCEFFSAISNGKGKVLFFTLKDIQQVEKENNLQDYDWNSHTSIAHYYGIEGEKEDLWNKWQYNNEKKELGLDGSFVAGDDSKTVKKRIEKYLADNNVLYCQKIYKKNSGYRNSGNRNSGNWNSGNLNTIQPSLRIFNKLTKIKRENINYPDYFYFELNVWIFESYMTKEEKKSNRRYKTTEGYLKQIEYKEAWKLSFEKATKEDIAKTLKLPNFDYQIFEEISGISKSMLDKRLS